MLWIFDKEIILINFHKFCLPPFFELFTILDWADFFNRTPFWHIKLVKYQTIWEICMVSLMLEKSALQMRLRIDKKVNLMVFIIKLNALTIRIKQNWLSFLKSNLKRLIVILQVLISR